MLSYVFLAFLSELLAALTTPTSRQWLMESATDPSAKSTPARMSIGNPAWPATGQNLTCVSSLEFRSLAGAWRFSQIIAKAFLWPRVQKVKKLCTLSCPMPLLPCASSNLTLKIMLSSAGNEKNSYLASFCSSLLSPCRSLPPRLLKP